MAAAPVQQGADVPAPKPGDPAPGGAAAAILVLLDRRPADASICPSEAARLLAGEGAWRALMPAVRDAARALALAGHVELTQRGAVLAPEGLWRGAIRIRRRRR